MVLPNMLSSGEAHYPSDVLPRRATFRKYGDRISTCLQAATKYGLEVHVWKVCFNLLGGSKESTQELPPSRPHASHRGRPIPSVALPLASREPQAGIGQPPPGSGPQVSRGGPALDYIRYPGDKTCYCDGCRRRFETHSGRKVADWPAECYSGARKEEYNTWRCRQITALVEAVSREARKLRPGLKISAAVFPLYPACIVKRWPRIGRPGSKPATSTFCVPWITPPDPTDSEFWWPNSCV